ncbi:MULTISPECIES: replication initiator [unclassified Kribbella]|uniref:replication initiator n=1 Tax=unclassified Kribbella TaxID=2644121 RepID=UPI00301616F4
MTITSNPTRPPSGLQDPLLPIKSHRPTVKPGKRHNPASGVEEAIARAASTADYGAWLEHTASAGGCVRPVQLRGEAHVVSERTGRIISTRHTDDMPDGVIYKACGNRRAAVCPSCAEIYRGDTYQLVLAGLRGGKATPASVAQHPCAFVTFTAPSFGPVHSARKHRGKDGQLRNQVCRPRRKPELCPHGVDLRCHQTHQDGENILGTPLCLDCYDHDHQVVWNALSGELWRRTMDRAKDILRAWGRDHGIAVKLSYGKVAEMQARGVAHFHALVRLDGGTYVTGHEVHRHRISDKTGRHLACMPKRRPETCPHGVVIACRIKHVPDDPSLEQPLCPDCAQQRQAGIHILAKPHLSADHALVHHAVRIAVERTRLRSLPHPDNPDGWLIEWGTQLDVRPVRQAVDGEITETAVAGYLAKYATKGAEATGHSSARLTNATVARYATRHTHAGRLVDACWRLGRPGSDLDEDEAAKNSGRLSYRRLQRWAHMLGFGGHFSTKSRQYSTTLKALREARAEWRRERHRTADHTDDVETTLIVGSFTYAATGWRTIGDALLANTAAAKAREHRRLVKELLAESNND